MKKEIGFTWILTGKNTFQKNKMMKRFLSFLVIFTFHSWAFSQVWEEVSADDYEELKAFNTAFSKLDTEAVFRLLPFSNGDGFGYLDQQSRKIIVQPCATYLKIPKRKTGKQILGEIENQKDKSYYFEVSWERDKGLIFTKKHQQISAPSNGIDVKKVTKNVKIHSHQEGFSGFRFVKDSLSGNLLISEFSDLYLYEKSKKPNLDLIEIEGEVFAIAGIYNEHKKYIYGVIDQNGKPLGELDFKYSQITLIENLDGGTDFMVKEMGESYQSDYFMNHLGERHTGLSKKYYSNLFVMEEWKYPYYYKLSTHKNVLGFVWNENEILDFLEYKSLTVNIPAGYEINSWQPLDYLDLKDSDTDDIRTLRKNAELLLEVSDGKQTFFMNLEGKEYRPQLK